MKRKDKPTDKLKKPTSFYLPEFEKLQAVHGYEINTPEGLQKAAEIYVICMRKGNYVAPIRGLAHYPVGGIEGAMKIIQRMYNFDMRVPRERAIARNILRESINWN